MDVTAYVSKFFHRKNDGIEQATVRVAFAAVILGYSVMRMFTDAEENNLYTILSIIFMAYAIFALCANVIIKNEDWQRKIGLVWILLDTCALTLANIIASEYFAPMIGVYLWIIMSNGFRHGVRYLFFAITACLTGMIIATHYGEYWQQHTALAYGLFSIFALLSIYTWGLLCRLDVARSDAIEARDEANRANEAKTIFLANMSHEIRTPLNGVIGATHLLTSTSLSKEQKELIDVVNDSGRSLLDIISNILDISKIEAGKLVIEKYDFDLLVLLDELRRFFHIAVAQKNIVFQITLAEELKTNLVGDVGHIKQVLINLIGNAVKFTEHGSVRVSVSQKMINADKVMLKFEVIDTGIGMDATTSKHVFDKFTQAQGSHSKNYGGTGLGTTICKNLVEGMGGDIWVSSSLNIGTKFTFTVPCKVDAATFSVSANSVLPTAGPITTHSTELVEALNILVAEDNATNQFIIRNVLEKQGHNVTVVDDGEKALDELETKNFDCALIDLWLPSHNGLEVVKLHRFSHENPIPITIVTADTTIETQKACLDNDVRMIVKPIDAAELLRFLASVKANPMLKAKVPRAEDDISLISSERLTELTSMGQVELLQQMIEVFSKDMQLMLTTIKKLAEQDRWDVIRKQSHAMKGACDNIGAPRLSRLVSRITKASNVEIKTLILEDSLSLEQCITQTVKAMNNVYDEFISGAYSGQS